MTYLYTLYDALISINVPSDRARAVVEAMEQDMGTTLATKSDLDALRVATKSDLDALRVATRSDLDALQAAGKQDVALLQKDLDAKHLLLRQEFESTRTELKQDIDSRCQLLSKDIEAMRSSMIIWLGSIQVVGLSVLFAALRLS